MDPMEGSTKFITIDDCTMIFFNGESAVEDVELVLVSEFVSGLGVTVTLRCSPVCGSWLPHYIPFKSP